jgi:hypothetical protein
MTINMALSEYRYITLIALPLSNDYANAPQSTLFVLFFSNDLLSLLTL